ncbi:MAG: DUF5710 domain-containing protein [Methylotenera sp.]
MIAETNISLKVAFNEKDQAKSLGAHWNGESKHWFIPQGLDVAPFQKWLTNSPAPTHNQPVKTINSGLTTDNRSFEDDVDSINARLRDAYESDDNDAF